MEPARQRHRSALISAAAGTAAAVAVVAVGGWFGLNHLPPLPGTAAEPTPSGSPSDNLIAVTWDPEPDYDAAVAGFHFPECGEKFDPEPQAVGGVTPKPQVEPADWGPGDEDGFFVGDELCFRRRRQHPTPGGGLPHHHHEGRRGGVRKRLSAGVSSLG